MTSNRIDFKSYRVDIIDYYDFCKEKALTLTREEDEYFKNIITSAEDLLYPEKALDRKFDEANKEYELAYSDMNRSGEALFKEREASVVLIEKIEILINSIAASTKTFDKEIREIIVCKNQFKDARAFGKERMQAKLESFVIAGSGVAAGAAIAALSPSTMTWMATTFGTASTGRSISDLSGAAKDKAVKAWWGGGAKSKGGRGIKGGQDLLGSALDVGLTTGLISIFSAVNYFQEKKQRIIKGKAAELAKLTDSIYSLKRITQRMDSLAKQTISLRIELDKYYDGLRSLQGCDYRKLTPDEKSRLGALINNTKSLAASLTTVIEG